MYSLRTDSFLQTLRSAGIPDPKKNFFLIPQDNEINIRALWNEIAALRQKITGAFCYSDSIAMHLLLHLNSLGIRVPQDFSICGFGDMFADRFSLTTVQLFPEKLGFAACTRLIDLIKNPDSPAVNVLSPVELVNPHSTVASAKM